MKKFILMTMTTTLMAGCSTDEENECTSPPNEYPVEIMASAGVSGIQTRSPINTGQSVTAGFIASASGGDYSTNLWTAAGTFTASTTTSATFSLTPRNTTPLTAVQSISRDTTPKERYPATLSHSRKQTVPMT